MADKEGETFDEAVEERVINEEYKVSYMLIVDLIDLIFVSINTKYNT
jgi:hypothetical protein